jgi:hypothetical protein
MPRARLAADALDQCRYTPVRLHLFCPVSENDEGTPAVNMTREVMQELQARIVYPMNVVDDDDDLAATDQCVEQLLDCVKQAHLARFGKLSGECRQVRHTLRDGRR